MGLERIYLHELRCQNLVKQRSVENSKNEANTEFTQILDKKVQDIKKLQSKLEKVIKKSIVDLQLEVEIRKFDNSKEDVQKSFESQLRKLIIQPYSERLQNFLVDLFQELNFSDSLIKEVRETRKLRKREMKTPQKSELRDLSKSPSYRKKRVNQVEAQT